MRVLLISFQEDLDALGLKSLHACLLARGHRSELLFLPRFSLCGTADLEALRKFISGAAPGLIGLTVMSHESGRAGRLTEYIKHFAPRIPVIWGGIHPTIAPEACLGPADYVCLGEGETLLPDLAQALEQGRPVDAMSGLCRLENGRVIRNAPAPLAADLDALPAAGQIPPQSYILHGGAVMPLDRKMYADYDRFYGRVYSIQASRGCPCACTYCCNSARVRLYGSSGLRLRSAAGVVGELAGALKHNPLLAQVNFLDDCFLAGGDGRLEEFCRLYKARVGLPFIIKALPAYITRARLEKLKAAGLAWLQVGLQSGSDKTCREIYRRPSDKEEFLRAARLVRELEIAPYYDVILDNPFETDEDRLETLDALARTPKPFYAQFYSLTLYPGTDLYEQARAAHPEALQAYLTKNYHEVGKTPINRLIRLAAFLGPQQLRWLVRWYRRAPASPLFRACLALVRLAVALTAEPAAYFRVLLLSRRGSVPAALNIIPFHFREWARRRN